MAEYDHKPEAGFAGQLTDLGPHRVDTAFNTTGGQLPFGIAVKRGAKDGEVALLASAADKIAGILAHKHQDPRGLTDGNGVADDASAHLLVQGRIYVVPEQDVTPADPVYVRHTTGTTEQVGGFRKDADTDKARKVFGARWATSGKANKPVALDIDVLLDAASLDILDEVSTS